MSFSCFVRILLVAVFAFSGVPWNLSVAQVLPVTVNIEWLPVTDAERRMNAVGSEPVWRQHAQELAYGLCHDLFCGAHHEAHG